jgi:lysophospholipid acyltransferase (LPLAT)-like uncharacterized protein
MKLPAKFRRIDRLPGWMFSFLALKLKLYRRFLLRVEIEDPHGYMPGVRSHITVTWHNRLLFFPVIIPPSERQRSVAVVSPSRDGQYIADLLTRFGLKSLRGSSSRKGARALRAAFQALDEGYNVCITPDGPRGPKYRMSRGPIHLASRSGRPIIPVSINASKYWAVNSWDNFQIPKPFSRLTAILGEAIEIPPDLDDNGIEEWRRIVEERLMAITID